MLKNLQRKIFSRFEDEFSKNIFKVFSGSSIGYFIAFASLPILTRIYTKEDFGNFQLLFSIILLLSSISSLKYEIAIVLPQEEDEADKLTLLSLISIGLTTILFGLTFSVVGEGVLKVLEATALVDFIPLVILGVMFNGIFQALQYVFIRDKKFGVLSKNRIYETSANIVLSVLLGLLNFNFLGLFYSKIFSLGSASTYIVLRQKLKRLIKIKLYELKTVARKYKDFPTINTPMVLINSISLELPIFMISSFFAPEIVGLFALSRRVLNIPLNLIGKSFSQVYYQSAAEANNRSKDELMKIYLTTVKKLALIGLVPVFLVIVAPQVFDLVFGDEWTEAGTYLQLMIFWIYFQFINYPIATTHTILGTQKLALIIIVISVIIRFLAMYYFSESPQSMILALSVAAGLFYIVYNISIYFSIKRAKHIEAEAS